MSESILSATAREHVKSAYDTLITAERLKGSRQEGRTLAVEMLSDKGRIVASSAFRRLQTKAQVFSLERNAAVRTRLTHTMEVACFGELIATFAFGMLAERKLIDDSLQSPFVTTVQNACFLHDVGNPPFGHLGEFAIQKWFSENASRIHKLWCKQGVPQHEIDAHYQAFTNFDGNPQAFRIVTRLQWLDNEYGLNLTCTLLASILKYLGTTPEKQAKSGSPSAFYKKIGFFETEKSLVAQVWKKLNLPGGDNEAPPQRHPLTFLMEAADDTAYCQSDIEDALEKGIVTEEMFFTELRDNCGHLLASLTDVAELPPLRTAEKMRGYLGDCNDEGNWVKRRKEWQTQRECGLHSNNSHFISFKVALSNWMVQRAAWAYIQHHEDILAGKMHDALLEIGEANEILEFLKGFARRHIFSSKEAVNIEVSGYRILQELLDGFFPLLELSSVDFKRLREGKIKRDEFPFERRLLTLLPKKHECVYREQCGEREPDEVNKKQRETLEPVHRAHWIVDYLSGMTDSHAVKVHDMLKGISVEESL